ncbi:CC_3452 family protein [Brevundimonas sp.]|uniref:CC_3452 family protein n=1 Tax=Brevundimonas sp. TaxID=1871086 RepID=UPI002FD8A58C
MRALLIAAALFAAAPAFAQPAQSPTRLTLAAAAQAPSGRTIIDGATWRCEGAACTASGGSSQPAPRACRRVAQRLGPVTAFSWKGVELSAAEIAACNA